MSGVDASPIWQTYKVRRRWENKIFSSISTSHDELSIVNKLELSSWTLMILVGSFQLRIFCAQHCGHNHTLNTNISKIKPTEGCIVLIKGSRPVFHLPQLSHFHRLHLDCNDLNKVEDIHRILWQGQEQQRKFSLILYNTKSLQCLCQDTAIWSFYVALFFFSKKKAYF